MTLTIEQGRDAVSYTRAVIEGDFSGKKPRVPESLKKVFAENRGVFVTLERHPEGNLRGCIGFPEPRLPLGRGVEEAALSAALHDPRFPPLREDELDSITVEVSILTKPSQVKVAKPTELLNKVVVGRDGLIAERGYFRGLLLPQVPVEWNWSVEDFLGHTCSKAGLPPDCWRDGSVKFLSFSAQIFSESIPRGEILEKDITGSVKQ